MGSYLIMTQRSVITGAMPIAGQCNNISQIHGTSHSNINAIMAHIAGHNQMPLTARFKLSCEIGLIKGITVGFVNHDIALYGGHFPANFPTF